MRHVKRFGRVLPLLLVPGSLVGQVAEFSFSGGKSLLRNSKLTDFTQDGGAGTEVRLKDGFRFGFRITLNNWRFLGHEFGYAYSRTKLSFQTQPEQVYGTAIHQGFYDMLAYATPEGSRVRPFAAGGGHFANYLPPGLSVTSGGGETKFGFNYGGGIKVRVSSMFLVRFDVRQYHNPKPDFIPGPKPEGWIRQIEASAGFALAL